MLVDAHIHLNLGGFSERSFVERFERGSTDQFWVSALQGGYYPTLQDVRLSNDMVHALMERLPGAVLGFAYLNPVHGAEALAELRRCVDDLGFRGIKLWVSTLCDDPSVNPIVEAAISYGMPLLVHCWLKIGGNLPFESTPMHLGRLARRFPEARFIMAHLGGDWEYGLKVARECPNVFVDTSGSLAEMGEIEALVEAIGVERVLFGTDNADLSFCLGKILGAGLSDAQREAIFWRNALTLLPAPPA